ncbi:hypothetical protein ACF09I_34615 [Streptomyces sp. NPDC014940]|uniref:hypothetical protein n=1 Tax=Streptomyces sp. NPDC014940 TaxID=3364932 RepID=UPI0036FE3D90
MITTIEGCTLAGIYATDEVSAKTLPIGTGPGQGYRTLGRVVVPVAPGDVLDITGRARVTNDTAPSYVVGVGYHLWMYDCDNGLGSSGKWWQISTSCGDNVDHERHHMPLLTDTLYTVPADWPAGHRMAIALRGDAMSTAADGQALTVDQGYGQLTVRRYAPAT